MSTLSNSTDPLALLKHLIRCPSVTPEQAGALDVVEAALKPLGFTVTRLRFEGGGSYPVDNLFATRGSGTPHLLFNGHTDVVPPGDEAAWTYPPFAALEADGRIYGRGAADMKSGLAAFIAAIARLPADHQGTLSLAITNDEEADSVNGTARLMDWAHRQGHRFDFALVGEPSSLAVVGDSIKIGRRGSLNADIVVTGRQGHVAYPDKALNPLPTLIELGRRLAGAELDQGNAHFPPSNIEVTSIDVGNPVRNVIPASARLSFNIRYNDAWTPETLLAWIEEQMASVALPGIGIALETVGTPSRSFLSPLNGGISVLSATIAESIGRPPQFSTGGGTSDARFIAPYCPVAEFGIVGPSLHQVDENIAIADLHALVGLYADFLGHYLARHSV